MKFLNTFLISFIFCNLSLNAQEINSENENCCYIDDLYNKPEKIKHLEIFSVVFNHKIDSCFKLAVELNYIEYFFSGLDYLPNSIAKLPRLDTLKISLNATKIPINFKKLHRLKYLYIAGSNFEKLPSFIRKFQSLTHLELDNINPIKDELGLLVSLRNLRFLSIFLNSWEYEKGNVFPEVEYLGLFLENQDNFKIETLYNMKQLKVFESNIPLNSNNIDKLSKLSNLKALMIDNNSVELDSLKKLSFLELLFIEGLTRENYSVLKKSLPNTLVLKNKERLLFRHYYLFPDLPLKENVLYKEIVKPSNNYK